MKDIMLGLNDDLDLSSGDFKIAKSLIQETGIILRLNKGDLKSDPILGTDLIKMINGKTNKDQLDSNIKKNLGRDGKNYEDIKQYITLKSKTNND